MRAVVLRGVEWPRRLKLTGWTAAVVMLILGVAVFSTGLKNPFLGDDYAQIVYSLPVHSIANIPQFFEGGTMYNGQGEGALTGVYYRPMMTTVYSLVYAVFGPNPTAFHALQLVIHIVCAFLCFLVFRYFLNPALAFVLALVFLVHPVNTQAVFAIATLQEPLFFGFGMLAVWLLLRFKSKRSLLLVAVCLFLSLLSKETGILFAGIAVIYTVLFDRKRFLLLAGLVTTVTGLYLVIKTHAVGLADNPHLAPISELGLFDRLANGPAITVQYLILLAFPLNLAYGYYWVHSGLSFNHFWLPLIVVVDIALAAAYLGAVIRRRRPEAFRPYLFFAAWFCIGLLLHLHLVPLLDMTASTTWLYFPMIGFLGMVGVAVSSFKLRLDRRVVVALVIGLLVLLSARSFVRGFDWRNQPALATADIAAGEDSYVAESVLAYHFMVAKDLERARMHAEKSVSAHVVAANTSTLGRILERQGDFARAKAVLLTGIERQPYFTLYEDLADVSIVYPEPASDKVFFEEAVRKFPRNDAVWAALAVAKYRLGDVDGAKSDIGKARELSKKELVHELHDKIMSGQAIP